MINVSTIFWKVNIMANVAVVLGSTRPGRAGQGIAQWVVSEANKVEGVSAAVVDLADFDLPFFAEPVPPSMEAPKLPEAVRFAQVLGAADAVVFVTPEYNQSIPGVLKNAIDYLPPAAMDGKKIGLVGYSWHSAASALAHLRTVLAMFGTTVEPQLGLNLGTDFRDGALVPTPEIEAGLRAVVEALKA